MNRVILQAALTAQRTSSAASVARATSVRPTIISSRFTDTPRFFATSLRLVYGSYDLEMEPEPDELIKFIRKPTMKEIKQQVGENFGMEPSEIDRLEYFEKGNWKPLKDPSQIDGKKSLPIRFPDSFDDEHGGPSDDDDDDYRGGGGGGGGGRDLDDTDYGPDDDYNPDDEDEDYGGYNPDEDEDMDYANRGEDDLGYGGPPISSTVKDIIMKLKEHGYIAATDQYKLKAKDGKIISTRAYVLNEAKSDGDLQSMIVEKIGALDHIVQCVHFDFLWKATDKKKK